MLDVINEMLGCGYRQSELIIQTLGRARAVRSIPDFVGAAFFLRRALGSPLVAMGPRPSKKDGANLRSGPETRCERRPFSGNARER